MKAQTKPMRTAGILALCIAVAAAMACAALAYGAVFPSQASADMETVTHEIEPEAQKELIEIARADMAEGEDVTADVGGTQVSASSAADEQQEPAAPEAGGSEAAGSAATDSEGTGSAATEPLPATTPADDCMVTIKYLEYAPYDDPDAVIDEGGRRVLGTRVLKGLHEGDVLNAWDYVLDLPGHFFFDGWPLNMTVTTDPAKNVFDLIYVKLWNSEYTVNYYLMTGADLDSDTWEGALAPDDVHFIKMGSETFKDQRFDELVDGTAYEYPLDGLYAVDAYPHEIRLGTDAADNVINVLYTPEPSAIPDDAPVPPDAPLPGNNGGNNDMAEPEEIVVTDEMLANPVDQQEAQRTLDAYKTGLNQGTLSQTGDGMLTFAWVLGGIAIVAALAGIVAIVVWRRRKTDETKHAA